MSLRKLARVALHLILVVSMGLASVVAPVAAAQESLAAISGMSAPVDTVCAHMGDMPGKRAGEPAPKAHCSLATCLCVPACTPDMLRVVAYIPSSGYVDAPDVPFVPSGVTDNPLRPPIV